MSENIRNRCKFFNRSYYSKTRQKAENFIYWIFVPYLQYKLLDIGKAFLHSAAITKNNETILFVANPNVGKTSISLKFVLNDDYKLLSDDLPIISSSSNVYSYHRPLAVYPFHFKYSEFLRKQTLKESSFLNILHWHFWKILLGQERVLRRLPNLKIFGMDKLAQSSVANKIFFLLETTAETFKILKATPKDIAERSAYIYLYETHIHQMLIFPLHTLSTNIKVPTTEELLKQLCNVYEEAFKGAELYVLYLPITASPDEAYAFIKDNLV